MAAGDVPPEPRVKTSIKQAWTNIWPHFWWLLLFGFLSALANGIDAGTTAQPPAPEEIYINVGGGLIGIFLGIPLSMGLVKAHLAASRGEKPTWQDFGYAFGPRYWATLGVGLLSFLIVLGGLLLLIIPGIYFAVKLAFADVRFIEDGLGPVEAIKASWADTKGHWWPLFGLALMALLFIIAGVLALVVGVFVAMVLIPQMFVVYWRSLTQHWTEVPVAD